MPKHHHILVSGPDFCHVAEFARIRAHGRRPHSGECGYDGNLARISGQTHVLSHFLVGSKHPMLIHLAKEVVNGTTSNQTAV